MTQEDKQLLLKDLSARFTYDIIVSVTDGTIKYNAYIESVSYKYIQVSPVDSDSIFTAYTFYKISEIKPYLRSMSSMTETEREEYSLVLCNELSVNRFDWLNAHHFDYRSLIEKGLALEAPEGMYGKEEQQ